MYLRFLKRRKISPRFRVRIAVVLKSYPGEVTRELESINAKHAVNISAVITVLLFTESTRRINGSSILSV